MPFPKGNNKQLNFLHALASDKTKGIAPISKSLAIPTAQPLMPVKAPGPAPAMPINPIPVTHMPQPASPRIMPMAPRPPMNPVAAPGLPALGNLPKFGKTRNSLRGSPFNKSNKA